MIEGGLAITPEDYGTALDEQARMSRAFDAMISSYDVLLCLSTAGEAPIGLETEDPPDTCLVWTLLGAPTISLPLLQGDTGLPVGAQLISRRYGDYKLLSFAKFALSGQ
jgi:Asp-tRNA(Asn)/Glu-tRNA(Gln) amidotransferase A subunit family amidase